jgi:hypothetical protein
MVRTGKTEVIRAKLRPLPFRQPQIPNDWPELERGHPQLNPKDSVLQRVIGHRLTYTISLTVHNNNRVKSDTEKV